jgi:hypothetical protein
MKALRYGVLAMVVVITAIAQAQTAKEALYTNHNRWPNRPPRPSIILILAA